MKPEKERSKVRGPLRQLRGHCAHWDEQAEPPGCSGRSNGDCLLEDCKRCSYFEKSVLPLHNWGKPHYAGLQDTPALYGILVKGPTPSAAKVSGRLCACGEPLPKRHRLCDKCKKQNRRDAYRREKQRQRE